jgi:hypothetical protein
MSSSIKFPLKRLWKAASPFLWVKMIFQNCIWRRRDIPVSCFRDNTPMFFHTVETVRHIWWPGEKYIDQYWQQYNMAKRISSEVRLSLVAFLVVVVLILGDELRASCWCSTMWVAPPALFVLGSHFVPRPAWTSMLFHAAEITGTCCHAQPIDWDKVI